MSFSSLHHSFNPHSINVPISIGSAILPGHSLKAPDAIPYLSERFDPQEVRTLGDLESLHSGETAWERCVKAGLDVQALQVAEGNVTALLRNNKSTPDELVSSLFELGTTFLLLNKDSSLAATTISDGRIEFCARWPEHRLTYELNVVSWAAHYNQKSLLLDGLSRIQNLCEHHVAKSQDPRPLARAVVDHLRIVGECLEQGNQYAELVVCKRVELDLLELANGISQESAFLRFKLARFLLTRDESVPNSLPQALTILEAAKGILKQLSESKSELYVLILGQLGNALAMDERWDSVLRTARELRKVRAALLLDKEKAEEEQTTESPAVSLPDFAAEQALVLRSRAAEGRGRHVNANRLMQRMLVYAQSGEEANVTTINVLEAVIRNAGAGNLPAVEEQAHRDRLTLLWSQSNVVTEAIVAATNEFLMFLIGIHRPHEGLAISKKLVEDLKKVGWTGTVLHIEALETVSVFERMAGNTEKALIALNKALEIGRKSLPRQHRSLLLSILSGLAYCESDANNTKQEYRYLRTAVKYAAVLHGVESAQYGQALEERAGAFITMNQPELAKADIDAALKIFNGMPERALRRSDLKALSGDIAYHASDFASAIEHYEDAVRELKIHGMNSPQRMRTLLSNLGICIHSLTNVIPNETQSRIGLQYAVDAMNIGEQFGLGDVDGLDETIASTGLHFAESLHETREIHRFSVVLARIALEEED